MNAFLKAWISVMWDVLWPGIVLFTLIVTASLTTYGIIYLVVTYGLWVGAVLAGLAFAGFTALSAYSDINSKEP
jgi:hypothetical protein